MKRFFLSQEMRTSLLSLGGQTATRIAADEWEAIIEFPETRVRCSLVDEAAASQNPHDEVIRVAVDLHTGGERPETEMLADLPGRTLTDILVVDTIVYFTDHKTYGASYRAGRSVLSLFSRLRAALSRTPTNRLRVVVDDMLVDATGGHEELTALPTSDSWRDVDPRFVNHVETGVIFVFDELCLPAFTANNGFAMVCSRARPLQPLAEVSAEHGGSCRFTRLTETPLDF